MSDLEIYSDTPGIVDVPGFAAAAAACDIRNKKDRTRLDLAVIRSEGPCAVAGVFTINAIRAAPVRVCEDRLGTGDGLRGFVANSGNANACTGAAGLEAARTMAREAALAAGCPEDSFLVCSTGRIGDPLPMDRIVPGIREAGGRLSSDAEQGRAVAEAILTSDTRPKTVTVRFGWKGKTITVAGFAKGAGMIQPNMATMLAFLATDLAVERDALRAELGAAVKETFNAITVDGDMSTNDTVLLFANGASGVSLEAGGDGLRQSFFAALRAACDVLAEKIVSDGEKITKVVELRVDGAASDADAEKVARAIGNSLLVKSSWYGEDPNWGRLADAAGYSGAKLEEEKLDIIYGEVPAMLSGRPLPENKARWKEIVAAPRFIIKLGLNLGAGSYRLLATDLTEGYVDYNKSE